MSDYNKTHLSIDNAEKRGFLHRDYIAHCFRWSHVIKHLSIKSLFRTAKILDIGCGKEIPLAKTLYSSKMIPTQGFYIGADVNRLVVPEMFSTDKFPLYLLGETDMTKEIIEDTNGNLIQFDVITCFEVLEHIPPQSVVDMLRNIYKHSTKSTTIFISTPNYNGNAAGNHPNEMRFDLLRYVIEKCGFEIVEAYGTFASIKDYESKLREDGYGALFDSLRDYYDTNVLACIFAPLYPWLSRNILWTLRVAQGSKSEPRLIYMKSMSNGLGWVDILEELHNDYTG